MFNRQCINKILIKVLGCMTKEFNATSWTMWQLIYKLKKGLAKWSKTFRI